MHSLFYFKQYLINENLIVKWGFEEGVNFDCCWL